jgi:predicted nucleotidyltransferase
MKGTQRVPLGGAQVCFVSLEDPIIHKLLAGRPRDLEDVRSILLKNRAFDLEYVQRWLHEFDGSPGEKSLKRFEEMWHCG